MTSSARSAALDAACGTAVPHLESLEQRRLLAVIQPASVDAYVDSIGINIKLDRNNYTGSDFTNKVVPALDDLQIRHARDGLKLVENSTYRARYQSLYDNYGVGLLGIFGLFEDPNGTPDRAPDVAKLAPGVVEAIGGPNEPDVFTQPTYKGVDDDRQTNDGDPIDYAGSRLYQNDLFADVNADSATQDITVATPAMAFAESVRYINPASHDVIAQHRYTGTFTHTRGINNFFNRTREWNGDQPIWITEAGHVTTPNLNTPQSVSERAQGVYMPRMLTEYFGRGVERTYIHQLMDIGSSNTSDTQNWGLIRNDGTLKPSYNALDTLIDTLNEATWNTTTKEWVSPNFTPDAIDVSYTKSSNQIRTPVVLQKSDGRFYFLTYRDVDVVNPDTKANIDYGQLDLDITFNGNAVSSFTHWRFNDNGDLVDVGGTLSSRDSKLSAGISDEMSIIEVRLDGIGGSGPFQQDTGPDGIVSVEAENFDNNTVRNGDSWSKQVGSGSSNAHMEVGPDNGTTFNNNFTNSSPELEYQVNFTKTGTHYVWVRGKAGGSSAGTSDSVHVGLNGNFVSTADRITGFGQNFGWIDSTMDGNTRATINVTSPGVKTLNVWMREDGFDFDKIVLTTSSTWTPSGTGPAESPREAPATLRHRFSFEGTDDDVVSGVNGTLRNGAALTTNSQVGNQALQLDGTNDRLDLGTLAEGDEFSIAGWVRINAGESNIQSVLSNMSGSGSGYLFGVNSYQTSDRKLFLETRNANGTTTKASTTANAVPLNQWVHVAAVIDRTAGTARLYVDGVDQTSDSTVRNDFKINATAKLGAKGDGAFSFGGRIDDLRIYNGQLSAGEVASLAGSGSLSSFQSAHDADAAKADSARSSALSFAAAARPAASTRLFAENRLSVPALFDEDVEDLF